MASRPGGSRSLEDLRGVFPAWIRALPPFEGAFDAYRLEARGCEVLFASYPPGTEIPTHDHETNNCGVILSGELVLEMGGETRRYGPGQWYEIPAGVPHAARFDVATSEVEFWFEPDA